MNKTRINQILGVVLSILFLILNYSPYIQDIRNTPSELQIFEGETKVLNFRLPVKVKIEGDNINVLKFNGNSLKDKPVYYMNEPLSIETVSNGDVSLYFKLFGVIPIKQMKVKVRPQKKIIPGGNSIGVSIYTQGALIVGTSEIMDKSGNIYNPAFDAGLKPGDVIEKVNGVFIKDADHLSILVDKMRNKGLELEVKRGNVIFKTHIIPAVDANDSKCRLGLWVRDSTAGVGTLTFIDPETNNFGALGHAITDIDTGMLIPIKNGQIVQSRIIDVKLGKRGKPGELRAVFSNKHNIIGSVVNNTKYGIFGKTYKNLEDFQYNKPLPIAYQDSVRLGEAKILSTTDDKGISEFSINIIKINRQSEPSPKSLVVEITDPNLLKHTGGIVQGMSGSPIIQDGKLVGAITHVFVNDPRKGYGIFIEWMLDESKKVIE